MDFRSAFDSVSGHSPWCLLRTNGALEDLYNSTYTAVSRPIEYCPTGLNQLQFHPVSSGVQPECNLASYFAEPIGPHNSTVLPERTVTFTYWILRMIFYCYL